MRAMAKAGRVGIVLGAVAFVGACVGADPAPTGSGGGTDGGIVNGAEGGGGCSSTQKTCDGRCVATDDPAFGCADASCAPCAAATAANTVPSCNAGACAVACAEGFADCDGDPKNGCEVKIATDVANCGKCGNVCGAAHANGKTCSAGKCVFDCEAGWGACGPDPEGCNKNIAADDKNCGKCGRDCVGGTCSASECSIVALATNQAKPAVLALDTANVYFILTDTSQIKRVAKSATCDGAACTEVVPSASGVSNPSALATDGTSLFWANYNASATTKVRRSSISGANPTDVGDSFGTFAGFLAVGGGKVVWTNRYLSDHVYRANADGSNVAVVALGNNEPGWVAADATHVYWASYANARIYRNGINAAACTMGISGAGACEEVATAANVYAIALDANNVYFTELVATGAVRKVPKAGGAVVTLATAQPTPQTIATDGIHVYWGNFGSGAGSNSVRRAKVDAPAPCAADACELVADVGLPNSIVLDDKAVYWVAQYAGGAVYKRAK